MQGCRETRRRAVTPRGWILEYVQKPKCHDKEIFSSELDFEIKEVGDKITDSAIDISNVNFKVDDKFNIEYQGNKSIGKVARIYNNGETLNVAWDGKRTAFYYKNVRRAESSET